MIMYIAIRLSNCYIVLESSRAEIWDGNEAQTVCCIIKNMYTYVKVCIHGKEPNLDDGTSSPQRRFIRLFRDVKWAFMIWGPNPHIRATTPLDFLDILFVMNCLQLIDCCVGCINLDTSGSSAIRQLSDSNCGSSTPISGNTCSSPNNFHSPQNRQHRDLTDISILQWPNQCVFLTSF